MSKAARAVCLALLVGHAAAWYAGAPRSHVGQPTPRGGGQATVARHAKNKKLKPVTPSGSVDSSAAAAASRGALSTDAVTELRELVDGLKEQVAAGDLRSVTLRELAEAQDLLRSASKAAGGGGGAAPSSPRRREESQSAVAAEVGALLSAVATAPPLRNKPAGGGGQSARSPRSPPSPRAAAGAGGGGGGAARVRPFPKAPPAADDWEAEYARFSGGADGRNDVSWKEDLPKPPPPPPANPIAGSADAAWVTTPQPAPAPALAAAPLPGVPSALSVGLPGGDDDETMRALYGEGKWEAYASWGLSRGVSGAAIRSGVVAGTELPVPGMPSNSKIVQASEAQKASAARGGGGATSAGWFEGFDPRLGELMPLKEWDDLLGADGNALGAQGGYECFRRPAPAVVVVLSDARPASSEFRTALEALAADGLGAKRTLEKISLVAINSDRPEYNMKIIERLGLPAFDTMSLFSDAAPKRAWMRSYGILGFRQNAPLNGQRLHVLDAETGRMLAAASEYDVRSVVQIAKAAVTKARSGGGGPVKPGRRSGL